MSQSRREKKSCPLLFSSMPRCQLAVRSSRQELGAMLINISAPDTFNQQSQLGQCICKKVIEYLFWFPSNLLFGERCRCRWQSAMLLRTAKQIRRRSPQRGRREEITPAFTIIKLDLKNNTLFHNAIFSMEVTWPSNNFSLIQSGRHTQTAFTTLFPVRGFLYHIGSVWTGAAAAALTWRAVTERYIVSVMQVELEAESTEINFQFFQFHSKHFPQPGHR